MLSAFFITTMLFVGLLLLAVLAVVGFVFRATFSLLWLPLKIVGLLVGGVALLAVGLPLLAVAVPVVVVLGVVAVPLLLIGGLFFGGLSLFGFAC